jgi:hypothetical protein
MKIKQILSLKAPAWVLSLVVLGAAWGATSASASPADEPSAEAVVHTAAADDDMLTLLTSLTDKLNAAGANCDQAAKDLDAFLDANAEKLTTLSKALDAHLATLDDKALEAFGARSAPIFEVIIRTAMKTCAESDAYQESFQSLDLLLSGQDDEEQDLGTAPPDAPPPSP